MRIATGRSGIRCLSGGCIRGKGSSLKTKVNGRYSPFLQKSIVPTLEGIPTPDRAAFPDSMTGAFVLG
jgi:hypothetical protein